ncbi:MAG: glycosyltransferase family 4 protein [Phaeodactylibacter sp.]|nr:glycosyltransferase family 4 protein [Phaeodactylibacter sp.]
MKRKVLIHAPNLSTPGGKQTYYAAVKDHFEDEVSFFFYGGQGKNESKLSKVRRLIHDYWLFYSRLRKERYDLVLLNPSFNLKSFFRDSVFALACYLLGVKFVAFWHGWQWEFEKKVVRRIVPFFRHTFGRATAMIVLAREFEDKIREYGFRRPVHLETTVVDDFIFDYGRDASNAVESEKAGSILLFLARVEKVKGIYESIDSFHRLQDKHPGLVLNVAGTGGELEAAKQYVADKGIRNVNFMGWITGEQKAQALYEANIFLLASYHGEGMPCSLLEAMACGLPVVTTNAGGIKDFFQPGKMGLFVRPADAGDLERQLDALLSDPGLMEKIQSFNANYAVDHFRPELVAGRLERIFERAVSETGRQKPVTARPVPGGIFSSLLSWPPHWRQAVAATIMAVIGLTMMVVIDAEGKAGAVNGEGMVEEAIEEALEEVSEELVQLIDKLDGEANKAF